jgi:hypothetical protein
MKKKTKRRVPRTSGPVFMKSLTRRNPGDPPPVGIYAEPKRSRLSMLALYSTSDGPSVPRAWRVSAGLFLRALRHVRVLAGYECAGVDQPVDATTPCGKCGPCEASAFIAEVSR